MGADDLLDEGEAESVTGSVGDPAGANRMAATELGVSVRTVGTQLRSVFTKLDLRRRVQLANALRRRGLP